MPRKTLLWLLLLLPAFSLLFRYGIHTMHDPHLFRVQQFSLCAADGVFPCRWSPDSAKGYGVPMFNFYAQAPYWFTQIFITSGLSIIDSLKIVFTLSFVLSGYFMYLLARKYWGNLGGVLSSVLYVFAPYRAVDVWVRGALPEALGFVFYPLIILFMNQLWETRKFRYAIFLALSLAGLLTTHNLSFLMFTPFLAAYWLVLTVRSKDFFTSVRLFTPAALLAICLTSYYWLPVIIESRLVTLSDTVSGYYNYKIHFATLRELFISRYWGYGASLWAQKFLSISIGHLHWILAFGLGILFAFRRPAKLTSIFYLFAGLGIFALFLTHGKSSIIWNNLPFMAYIQFPWRFLTVAVFFLSLAGGAVSTFSGRKTAAVIMAVALFLYAPFFRPDIWRSISDSTQFSGTLWDEGRSSSLTDFWPVYGSAAPSDFAPISPPNTSLVYRKAHQYLYHVDIQSPENIMFPITYFPGWRARVGEKDYSVYPSGELGQTTVSLPEGSHDVLLSFTDTWPRIIGNFISLLTLVGISVWYIKKHNS